MKKNLPTKVHFIDKVGTTIEIVLLKFRNNGYFTHEMQNILNHYHLKDNGWIKFNYIEFTQKKKISSIILVARRQEVVHIS